MAKGNFIEYVVSDNPNKYPNDGEQSGYYWELYGVANGTALISFTIDGTSYQAEEGMTWGEWVNSSYNNSGLEEYLDIVGNVGVHVEDSNGTVILLTDKIIANASYKTAFNIGL